ncbi:MAG TPA: hypothetical protein IAB55_10695 [Candidatus Merdivicinus faecavium]|nr:hypothetical protein [Candidatus Merdivicinus faecavium]
MKKTFRRIMGGVLAAALSLTVFALPAAAADGEVGITFTEDETIEFEEDGENGLFAAFQELYPGDTRAQEIYLRNEYRDGVGVTLRISPSDKAADLSEEQLQLVEELLTGIDVETGETDEEGNPVTEHIDLLHIVINNGSTQLYEGSVGASGTVPLGSLRRGYGAPLEVELTVNGVYVGNEYQSLIGYVDWSLTASWNDQYIPDPDPSDGGEDSSTPDEDIEDSSTPLTSLPEDASSGGPGDETIDEDDTPLEPFPEQDPLPQTGDNFPLVIAICGAVLCAVVVAVVLATGKNRKRVK